MLTHKCIAHVKQSTVYMAPGMHGGAHPAAPITLYKIMDPIKGLWPWLCRAVASKRLTLRDGAC